jgi:hypothetical protein
MIRFVCGGFYPFCVGIFPYRETMAVGTVALNQELDMALIGVLAKSATEPFCVTR